MVTIRRLVLAVIPLAVGGAQAQQIPTRVELEGILTDNGDIEDFEGVSVHGGTVFPTPNPLSDETAPWNMLPGASYSTPGTLVLYGGFLHGDDSNILEGARDLLVVFDEAQEAMGFDLVNVSGNVTYHDTITIYHNAVLLATLEYDVPAGSDFFVGWHDAARGVTSVRVVSDRLSAIDNVEFGLVVANPQCPADWDGSGGQPNSSDFLAYLNDWSAQEPAADLAPQGGDAAWDSSDFLAFLNLYANGC